MLSLDWGIFMSKSNSKRVYFENSQPILRVGNMQASLHFYVDLLRFNNAPWVMKTSQASIAIAPESIYVAVGRAAVAHGSGSALKMSRNFRKNASLMEFLSACHLPIIRGHWRCTSKIPMAM